MSLVNDALKKARLEAARGDAANRNIPYPLLGRSEQPTSGPWIIALGTVIALIVLAGLGGFFLYRAGKQSALRASLVTPNPAYAAAATPIGNTNVEAAKLSTPGEPAEQTPTTALDTGAGPTARSDSKTGQSRRPAGSRQASRTESAPSTVGRATTGPNVAKSSASRLSTRSVAPRSNIAPDALTDTPVDAAVETRAEMSPVEEHRAPYPTPPGLEPAGPATDEGKPPTDATPQEFLRRADIPGIGPIELGGIAWSGDRPFALVNGRVVRPGDTVSGLFVDDIQPNTVRFRSDQGTLVFKLK